MIIGPLAIAQKNQVIDRIIGVVGDKIVLESEVSEMFDYEKEANPEYADSNRCAIFYNFMAQQILVEQAARDSIIVTDAEVDNMLDDRIKEMVMQYGSKEAFEAANGGRTVYQLKDDFRTHFKEKSIAERMQSEIMQNVKITPKEIDDFFIELSKDTLPPFPASVEMGQIVIKPPVDAEVEQMAKEKLQDIRKDIVENGKSFEIMAGIYSMDGTRDNGGELDITRKSVDQQFAAAAFRLQPGEISPVIKTRFGYHIIQMVRRMGEDARVRHIVIVPEVTSSDLQKGLKKLDSVRADLMSGKITFSEAVAKYSTDENSKLRGGIIYSNSGSSILPLEALDPEMARAVGELKVGEYSQPQIFVENPQTGAKSTRIIYLRNRTDPHILNLKDDYSLIQQKALQYKQVHYLNDWIKSKVPSFYIKIDPDYADCPMVKSWVQTPAKP